MATNRNAYYREYYNRTKISRKSKIILGYAEPKPLKKKNKEQIIDEEMIKAEIIRMNDKKRMEKIEKFITHHELV